MKKKRTEMFTRPLTPAEISKYQTKQNVPINVVYKLLQKYYYWEFIDRLNKIVNTIVQINKWSIAELQTIYNEMKPILEHNLLLYNKFTNKKYNRQLFFPKPFSDYNCFY